MFRKSFKSKHYQFQFNVVINRTSPHLGEGRPEKWRRLSTFYVRKTFYAYFFPSTFVKCLNVNFHSINVQTNRPRPERSRGKHWRNSILASCTYQIKPILAYGASIFVPPRLSMALLFIYLFFQERRKCGDRAENSVWRNAKAFIYEPVIGNNLDIFFDSISGCVL